MVLPIISIVIPVYNSEKYLRKCMDSLLKQTFTNFEIICVDDGSTDNSCVILKEFEQKDNRITVIEQKNQYAGVARNNGMKRAKGKYLLFLDSDDFFCENMLEEIITKAEEDKTEILVFDAFLYDDGLNKVIDTDWKVVKKNLFGEGIKTAKNIAETIFEFTTSAPWNKLFLKEFVMNHNLQFQPIKRTNDLYFVYAAFADAERIGICDKKLLYYRYNNLSSLQGSGSETPTIFAESIFALKKKLEIEGTLSIYQRSFNNMALSICIYNLSNMTSKDSYCILYNSLRNEILPKLNICNERIDFKLEDEIYKYNNLIIYGAGTVAKALVGFLLYQCGYEKKKISVVVSKISQNEQQIFDIKVKEFKEVPVSMSNNLVLIAVSGKKAQDEIEKNVYNYKFRNVEKIGFDKMAVLIRNYGIHKDDVDSFNETYNSIF